MARATRPSEDQTDLFGDGSDDAPGTDERTAFELLQAYARAVRRELEAAGTECTKDGVGRDKRTQQLQARIVVKHRPGGPRHELVWIEAVGWVVSLKLSQYRGQALGYMRGTLTPPVVEVAAWARDAVSGRRVQREPRLMKSGGARSLRWQLLAVLPARGTTDRNEGLSDG